MSLACLLNLHNLRNLWVNLRNLRIGLAEFAVGVHSLMHLYRRAHDRIGPWVSLMSLACLLNLHNLRNLWVNLRNLRIGLAEFAEGICCFGARWVEGAGFLVGGPGVAQAPRGLQGFPIVDPGGVELLHDRLEETRSPHLGL